MRWSLRLLGYARRHMPTMSLLVLTMAGTIAFDLVKPWPLKLIVDSIGQRHAYSGGIARVAEFLQIRSTNALLFWLTVATVLCFVIGWAFRVVQVYLQARVGTSLVYDLGADLFGKLQRLSVTFHAERQTGDLLRRVTTDCTCARDLLLNVALPAAMSLLSLTGMAAVLCRMDVSLTLLALLILPLLALAIWRYASPMTQRTYEQAIEQGSITARASQVLSSVVLVRAFAQERRELAEYEHLGRQADAAGLRALGSQLRFKLSSASMTALGAAGVMAMGGYHVLEGRLTLGGLLVFLSYLQSFYGPLETLAYLSSGLAAAGAGARRVFEILDSPERVVEPSNPKPMPVTGATVGCVEFRDVSFGYRRDRAVLRNVDFTIQSGETIGIVGASGAGKSALVSLLPRLVDPWSGRILVNGVDVRTVSLSALRSQLAMALQEDFILPLTVAENISFGQPHTTLEEIQQAARAADAHDFISQLPSGYQTVLSERGASLSGGERQRLSIARALLKRAPILILDEPTSALDAETEWNVVQRLQNAEVVRTIIVVAHRLSTIRHADRILVLHAGRIVEAGTHGELLRTRSHYARLHQLQTAGATSTETAVL